MAATPYLQYPSNSPESGPTATNLDADEMEMDIPEDGEWRLTSRENGSDGAARLHALPRW